MTVDFFKRSELDTQLLKKFWIICAKTDQSNLTKDEFYMVLRLISYAQNGIDPSEESLRNNIPTEFPKFTPVRSSMITPEKSNFPGALDLDTVPSMDDMNIHDSSSILVSQPSAPNEDKLNSLKENMEKVSNSKWFMNQMQATYYLNMFT